MAPPALKVFLEKRASKQVTVISGLHTCGTARLEAMAKEMKGKFGCGGTVKDGRIELQGDVVGKAKGFLRDGC
ncbi:MAG: hypothetical protein LLG37_03055 [Spirochaetia bacterium]|nr:hypothetical protein [Spirochaetia bacterium]